MKSYKSVLAGEWFDGLSLGDDTYFMLNLQNHRQCPAGGFYLSGLRQCFDGSPVQGPTQWRAGSRCIPPSTPPIVVNGSVILHCKMLFRRCFRRSCGDVWRHFRVVTGLFIYLSGTKALLLRRNCGRLLRRSPLAAELLSSRAKPRERRAVLLYPVCALRLGRGRGQFARPMSGHRKQTGK
jgi:hypothetical protein